MYQVTTRVESTGSKTNSDEKQTQRYIWQPRPINIWVSINPCNPLQLHVLRALKERLEDKECIFVQVPGEETSLGSETHLGIGFGSNLREEIRPSVVYGRLPKPRGTALMITATESLPDMNSFDLARGQLVKKAAHLGIVVEGDLNTAKVTRAVWASMAGNNYLLNDNEEEIFDNLALRVQAHAGADKVNIYEGDVEVPVTWEQWSQSPVHNDIALAGQALGQANLIEDKVELDHYGSGKQARELLRFLERGALGEGMRSQLDPELRIMGVTATGGGKVNVDPDPMAGHVIPIGQVTATGYLRAIPPGCPITYNPPSIETHENGMAYLAGALVNAGLVNSFDGFLQYLESYFAQQRQIDILPEGMQAKFTAMEHFHRQPKPGTLKKPAEVEVVYPDEDRFPKIDFPCGVLQAELHLLSALFNSEAFRQPGPLNKVVIAVLPGHGAVALHNGPRQELIETLIHDMEMEDPARI